MNDWSPRTLYIAQFAFAGFAAMFALGLSKRDLSLRLIVCWTGFYCLAGGLLAPWGRDCTIAGKEVWPQAMTKTERLMAASFLIGSGLVPITKWAAASTAYISQYVKKKLGIEDEPNPPT